MVDYKDIEKKNQIRRLQQELDGWEKARDDMPLPSVKDHLQQKIYDVESKIERLKK